MKTELLSLVHEYLAAYGYTEAASTLQAEANAKGEDFKPLPHDGSTKENLVVIKTLEAFDRGSLPEFKQQWNAALPELMRTSDSTCVKLEFYAHVYFAIVGIHPHATFRPESYNQQMAMAQLRQYIEDKGAILSNEPELLPYFAMPYIPEPQHHATFATLFTDTWIPEIRARIEKYLLANAGTPASRLSDIVHEWEVQTQKGKAAHAVEGMVKQLEEVTEEKNELWIRHQQLQREYYNLLGVTDELVEAVVAGIRGSPVSQSQLDDICRRLNLFTTETEEDHDSGEEEPQDHSEDHARPHGSSHGHKGAHKATTQDVVPSIVMEGPLPPLDIKTFTAAITDADERSASLLLQALRWRVTRARPGPVRTAAVAQLIADDVLALADPDSSTILSLISSKDETLKLSAARLLNCLGSLSAARRYLLTSDSLIRRLFQQIQREQDDTPARRHLLGALQKLSLKRRAQIDMISIGVIDWLVDLLRHPDDASYYSVEYAVALLMNLCLRGRGKTYCQERARDVLGMLLDLLGYEAAQVRTYVHACLYSLFSRQAIRQEADMLGAESALRAQMRVSNAVMAKQLAHVLDQLARTDDDSDAASDDENDDEDEDEEEAEEDSDDMTSHNLMAADYEDPEPITAPKDQSGEHLLASFYVGGSAQHQQQQKQQQQQQPREQQSTTPTTTARAASPSVHVDRPAAAPTIATTASARPHTGKARGTAPDTAMATDATTSSRPATTGPRPTSSNRGASAMDDLRKSTAKLSQTLDNMRASSRPATGRTRLRNTNEPIQEEASGGDADNDGDGGQTTARTGPVPSKSKTASSGGDDDDDGEGGDGDETPEPEPVPIDEEASNLLASKVGKPLARADDKPAPPRAQGEDSNIDEYYAVFATRSKVPRTP
ncbi:hypothetical protein PTSG_06375 [Salpingoeca rosetta]|uniref:LisH domain-containing protein ARMC9 n=1 Tax=Salpingoeca rosetta (strain ATCC 50818 / BSB-021) TaxID=946362 RepID=F2UCQ7_SALR5|nr:uncharacterized protein PTSG_06375 [Salpingoeca rosetta]EGD74364.1 hypothetical protein PTSG_06375 [Salpingoeca rosetta]|eukprot:XP_004993264.1 hypothetical protein PTSG_06375 [Salpingoeca rosetta]